MDNTYKREVALRLKDVEKTYKIGEIGGGTLQGDLQSWWAKIRGREDPNSQIGEGPRLVGKTFKALNGINLTVYRGERLGIIGPNGAGKSTMLKLLSRVTAPSNGYIDLYGRITSMLEVGTGFNGEMTGRENVYMNGTILGMKKSEIDEKMDTIIDFSEVHEFIDTPVKRYSSGMYVKLAFSVAAHLDSEIVIMDEVLAVGDLLFQKKCLEKMKSIAINEDRTVLYVSHNMNTIRTLCDRCIVMNEGKIVFDGDVEKAIDIYSSSKSTEKRTYYDLSNRAIELSAKGQCVIKKLYINNVNLEMGEPLKFRLDISSEMDKNDINIRFIVHNRSGDTIGMSFSDRFMLTKGGNSLSFGFSTENLIADEYTADIMLCEYNNQTNIKQDSIVSTLRFEVLETIRFYDVAWNKKYWGLTRLNPIVILDKGKP